MNERTEIVKILKRIARSKPNDAVRLALDPTGQDVGKLDLWAVSEIKSGSNGSMEIKFMDRVKAIALLLEQQEQGADGMEALLEALEGE